MSTTTTAPTPPTAKAPAASGGPAPRVAPPALPPAQASAVKSPPPKAAPPAPPAKPALSAGYPPAFTISKGRKQRPCRVAVYGTEGVGKSTLAAQAPFAVVLDTEGGTHHLDVARIEISSWPQLKQVVTEFKRANHPYKTVVIDTIDWAEKLLAEHLCTSKGKKSIEDWGYGKGYVIMAEEFAVFLRALSELIEVGISVVVVAHAQVKRFDDPATAGYDRYELKLHPKLAPLVKEWCDTLLFANFKTKLLETDGKTKAIGGKERVLYSARTVAYDAKTRVELPDEFPASMWYLGALFGVTYADGERLQYLQDLIAAVQASPETVAKWLERAGAADLTLLPADKVEALITMLVAKLPAAEAPAQADEAPAVEAPEAQDSPAEAEPQAA